MASSSPRHPTDYIRSIVWFLVAYCPCFATHLNLLPNTTLRLRNHSRSTGENNDTYIPVRPFLSMVLAGEWAARCIHTCIGFDLCLDSNGPCLSLQRYL